ncbi:hypothetical protein PPERSA_11311 [Pseudocohnilembus persalinus]|uniref:Uncharacterized protein n=1 Tax=Pseudocohnilembus persalinus TaxID=266149 RepID=A0A0V0QPK0_PSEPJ|nr:hypothetical protein PPERSA_11311 [Pseudocohnilembus persalinus]|eukprot:KRX04187.1 hypothetical protein PPERSA_11311 [Pseudocohnilembus persalinus]
MRQNDKSNNKLYIILQGSVSIVIRVDKQKLAFIIKQKMQTDRFQRLKKKRQKTERILENKLKKEQEMQHQKLEQELQKQREKQLEQFQDPEIKRQQQLEEKNKILQNLQNFEDKEQQKMNNFLDDDHDFKQNQKIQNESGQIIEESDLSDNEKSSSYESEMENQDQNKKGRGANIFFNVINQAVKQKKLNKNKVFHDLKVKDKRTKKKMEKMTKRQDDFVNERQKNQKELKQCFQENQKGILQLLSRQFLVEKYKEDSASQTLQSNLVNQNPLLKDAPYMDKYQEVIFSNDPVQQIQLRHQEKNQVVNEQKNNEVIKSNINNDKEGQQNKQRFKTLNKFLQNKKKIEATEFVLSNDKLLNLQQTKKLNYSEQKFQERNQDVIQMLESQQKIMQNSRIMYRNFIRFSKHKHLNNPREIQNKLREQILGQNVNSKVDIDMIENENLNNIKHKQILKGLVSPPAIKYNQNYAQNKIVYYFNQSAELGELSDSLDSDEKNKTYNFLNHQKTKKCDDEEIQSPLKKLQFGDDNKQKQEKEQIKIKNQSSINQQKLQNLKLNTRSIPYIRSTLNQIREKSGHEYLMNVIKKNQVKRDLKKMNTSFLRTSQLEQYCQIKQNTIQNTSFTFNSVKNLSSSKYSEKNLNQIQDQVSQNFQMQIENQIQNRSDYFKSQVQNQKNDKADNQIDLLNLKSPLKNPKKNINNSRRQINNMSNNLNRQPLNQDKINNFYKNYMVDDSRHFSPSTIPQTTQSQTTFKHELELNFTNMHKSFKNSENCSDQNIKNSQNQNQQDCQKNTKTDIQNQQKFQQIHSLRDNSLKNIRKVLKKKTFWSNHPTEISTNTFNSPTRIKNKSQRILSGKKNKQIIENISQIVSGKGAQISSSSQQRFRMNQTQSQLFQKTEKQEIQKNKSNIQNQEQMADIYQLNGIQKTENQKKKNQTQKLYKKLGQIVQNQSNNNQQFNTLQNQSKQQITRKQKSGQTLIINYQKIQGQQNGLQNEQNQTKGSFLLNNQQFSKSYTNLLNQ